MITVSGLGSGLDIEGLVSQLVAAERQAPELRLNTQEATAQARLSAFGQLKGALSAFQTVSQTLDNAATYQRMTSSSTAQDVVGISASNTAIDGSYAVEVIQLAANHSLASGSFADRDTTAVGSGTLTIRLGTTDYDAGTDTYNSFNLNAEREILSLDIDSGNNTLQGISDAINAANAGISAAVVNDGSGYRLLLSSEFTGAENSLEVSVVDDDTNHLDTSGLSRLAFNSGATNLEQTVAATDAALTINGLAVTSSGNQIDSALDGVVLDLKQISTGPVQVDVSRDLASVQTAVGNFVSQFNQLQGTLNAYAGYDPETEQAGLLLGDFTVSAIEGRIKDTLRNQANGVQGDLQRLSQLGIATQADGTLAIEGTALEEALTNNLEGVVALFSALGQSSDGDVSYITSAADTQVGSYAVNITQLATVGSLAGAGALPDFAGGGSVTIDGDNDSFSLSVNGVDGGSVSLTQGTYLTGEALALEIQARVNSLEPLQTAGVSVVVEYSAVNNNFSINSTTLGAESTVEITAIDPDTTAELGFSVAAGTAGLNVAGTIGGAAATGNGQVLTADDGTAAAGLSLLIEGATTGNRGEVNFSRGLFNTLDNILDEFLANDGLLDSRSAGLQDRIDNLGEKRVDLETRMEAIEARYRRQFSALDLLLSQLQSTSEYLTQQLANLPKPGLISNS